MNVFLTVFCTDDSLLEPLLAKIGVNVVGWAGRVKSVRIEAGITKEITEVLENVQQLLGRVLEDGEHLGGEHVVDDKEGLLRVGLRAPQCDHILTRQLDKEMVLANQFILITNGPLFLPYQYVL
jgi:hypothetical protein